MDASSPKEVLVAALRESELPGGEFNDDGILETRTREGQPLYLTWMDEPRAISLSVLLGEMQPVTRGSCLALLLLNSGFSWYGAGAFGRDRDSARISLARYLPANQVPDLKLKKEAIRFLETLPGTAASLAKLARTRLEFCFDASGLRLVSADGAEPDPRLLTSTALEFAPSVDRRKLKTFTALSESLCGELGFAFAGLDERHSWYLRFGPGRACQVGFEPTREEVFFVAHLGSAADLQLRQFEDLLSANYLLSGSKGGAFALSAGSGAVTYDFRMPYEAALDNIALHASFTSFLTHATETADRLEQGPDEQPSGPIFPMFA